MVHSIELDGKNSLIAVRNNEIKVSIPKVLYFASGQVILTLGTNDFFNSNLGPDAVSFVHKLPL
jgi:hypothetical protein